ncbi:MAG: ImmA/IrrE family metallo-endopeptidase [Propionibacteriales bacterium]|nr:ImmA/IrrE family metallo-endopeptidase [Propionibacteriales bacterium]
MQQNTTTTETRSVLASLRAMSPQRGASFTEALRVAELQAARLLELWDIQMPSVPSEIVSELPRVQVVRAELPVSGTSHWSGHAWVITLNEGEAWVRQRFTLMHEFKHIIDHGQTRHLYGGDRRHSSEEQFELVADYFAGCVLMPKRLLKRAWGDGVQRPIALARLFKVSARAVEVRLAQTGLNVERDRCARPVSSPHGPQQFRLVSARRS